MKSLAKKLSSCVLPGDQLLPLLEAHMTKKHKKCDLPWVEMVKRLLTKAVDEDNGMLFENAATFINIQLSETVRKGLKNPSQFGQKYSDILNSLLTHLHLILEDTNLQVVEIHTLSSQILAAVIDMSIAAYKKGEEASLVAKIFMKLTMILGYSQEHLLDALLHCKTLIHSRLRQPSIQVPLIKRLFSSIRSGQTMAPVLYLKYLLLGKLWLFMTEKKELGKTRTYIAKVLKLPENIPDWAERERVSWLGLSQWSTRLILKSMTLRGAHQTFYGDKYEEIRAGVDYLFKKEKSPKAGSSKSCTNKRMTGKVQTNDHEEFPRPPFSEMSSDEDVKLELEIVNVINDTTDEEPLPCSSRSNDSDRKQKKKRKSKEVLTPKGKKRKVSNHVEEENELPATSKSISLMKTKSGLSKSSVNKKVCKQKKTDNICYKITEDSPEVPTSLTDSKESMKEEIQKVDINSHVADEGSSFSNKSIKKKGTKRKSVEVLEQKRKKGKVQNYKEDKETDAALTNKAETIKLKKKSKKTTKTMIGSSISSSEKHAHLSKADESDVLPDTDHTLEHINFSHPVEEKLETLEKARKKKSRKRPKFTVMDKEDLRDEIRKNSCQFDEVCEYSGDAASLGTSSKTQERKSSRKQKLSLKQKRIRRKSMNFTVTDLEELRDNFIVEEFENNNNTSIRELSVNEDNEIKAVNIMPMEEQVISSEKKASTDSHEEICNDASAAEYLRVHSVNTDAHGNSSEDSSDYDRGDGDEDNDFEHGKAKLELENSTECRKEEDNLIKENSTKDQAIHKVDTEPNDESNSSSKYADESDKGTLVEAKSNTADTSENDTSKEHQDDSFVVESDADVSCEEIQLESENTEDKVTIDVVTGNENRDGEVVLENGPDEVKDDCDSILSTNKRSNVFTKDDDEIASNASEQLLKESCNNTEEYENVIDEESNLVDDIIITKCIVLNPESKVIKIDNSTEEETVTLITSDQDEDGKDTTLEAADHCGHHDEDKEDDSKISNSFHDITVLESGCETKVIMGSISETSDVSQYSVRDDESVILKAPESDQAITSCKESNEVSTIEDTKGFIVLKEEPVVTEVEDSLEEVKQEGEIKTSPIKMSPIKMSPIKTSPLKASPIDVKDTSMMAEVSPIKTSPTDTKDASKTPLVHRRRSSEQSKDAVQDPVSRMMNNLYKSNTVKIDNSEKEGSNNEVQNSELLNGHENAISDDDDKSVIVDEDEEIESMLQNIVKDTGRPSSIHGLRERLLSESSVKNEQENSGHDVQDDKESIKNSEMSLCASQVKTSDSASYPLLESTEAMSSKSVTHIEDQKDTDSLLDTIVKDESRLAEIRGLREPLFLKAFVLNESMEISECGKDSKETTRENSASHFNSQIERGEGSPKNSHLLDDEVLPSNDTLSSDTTKKNKDLKDEPCTSDNGKRLTTGNDLSIPNDNEAKNIDYSSREVTRDKDQETSDDKHFKKTEHDNVLNDEFMYITSNNAGKENYSASVEGMNTIEEASPKTLDTESVETNEAEGLSDINTSTDGSLSLALKLSNTEEIESVMDESRDKCIEGADEAYEASSDASEDPAPRTRRRSRSLRKSFAQQELQMASDSDSSPVRAFHRRGSALNAAGQQRSKRRRSQSCSLESVSTAPDTQNKTQTLEKSLNKIFTLEKEYTFSETFTVTSKNISYSKASAPKDINIDSSEEKTLVASNESNQDVLPAESDKTPIVKNTEDTPHVSMETVVTETTETDAMESSSKALPPSSQNKEPLHGLTLAKRSISSSSDTTLKELPNKPSSPFKPNSDDVSQIESSGHSKNEVPSKVMEDTTAQSNTLLNKGETASSKLDVLSNEISCKSQDCEILIKEQNSLTEEESQKSLDAIKDSENQEPLSEVPRMKEHDTSDKAGLAEDIENGTEHEEIRNNAESAQVSESETQHEEMKKDAGSFQNLENGIDHEETGQVDRSQKHIDEELNQGMAEGIYEGEEVEVLSTSGIEEEDEKETVGTTPEGIDNRDVEDRKTDLLISKKSLRSHIRQLCLTKDGKDVSSDSGSKDGRLAQIPVGKAQCLSQVALTKEVLISPDVSDEECELVSPGVDLSDAKVPIEVDALDDSTSQKNVSLCFSNLNLQKSSGGINSPHKTIPEEQDETTIPKSSSDHCPKASTLQRSKTVTIPPSVSIPDTEKPDNRRICTRRSSRGVAGECASGSLQIEVPKSAKSHIKSLNNFSSIQKEQTVTSDPESSPDAPNRFAIENAGQKRKESLADAPKDSRSSRDSHDSVSSLCIDKESKEKKLQASSPSSAGSREKELNASRSASQERMLLSVQNQNSELLCEDSDNLHKPERCKVAKLLPAKNGSPDTPEDTVLKEDKGEKKSPLLSSIKEESSACDTPWSVGRPHTCLPSSTSSSSSSSSSSSTSPALLPVRRSSRLRNQSSDASFLTKDSRKADSSSAHSESEQEIKGEDKNTPGSPKNLRRSMRSSTTPRKALSEARLLTE
ncbi:serine-rich adhesin for platelets-like [Scylla paramamosain]|uniref:serine-rich adhesin for platelets-like n=1 Tax=Scylla paramamosain TaxID=85552 RepID=UPI003082715E